MPTLKTSTTHFSKTALTSGDPTGIGFEVICKALSNIGPQNKTLFFLYRDHLQTKRQPRFFKLLDRKFYRLTFSSEQEALSHVDQMIKNRTVPKNLLIDLSLEDTAAHWILSAAKACLRGDLTSMATGPISKTLIKKSGFKFMGHTGAFRKLCPKANLHMAFIGDKFNVLLATDHIPLNKVPARLSSKTINSALAAARQLKALTRSKKNIGLLGLNPHAGESGLIGTFEKKCCQKLSNDISGPLVPDAAFLKKNWGKYSVYVCLYHDQGLIPFKLVHGQDSGVHITLGLPFVRTSVDHGTAFDIYNKNLANPASMIDAIRLNLKLTRG